MRIKTQFILTVLMGGIIVVAIATSVIISNHQVNEINNQETIASNIQMEASDLSYLANDYLLYQESQQLARWESKFAAMTADLGRLKTSVPEQQNLINNIKADQQRLQTVFNDVKSTINRSATTGETENLAFVQVSWSRIEVQSQGIVSEASRFNRMLDIQSHQLEQTNIILIFVLIGIFLAFFVINFLLVDRRLLKSISFLQNSTRIIGSGNLDYHIPEKGKDEIGELSHAFNLMTANLKTVTASKTDLETEIVKRNEIQEELQVSNEHLQDQTQKLEEEIAEREQAELELRTSHNFLEIANKQTGIDSLLLDYVREVKRFTNCEAIGIRLLDESGNIPYLANEGFSQKFFESESPLSINSDQCMCVNVIKGTTDPAKPFYTARGSFYMNGTTRCLATVPAKDKGETRNVCNAAGYESVALIPIKAGDRIIGLIHLADKHENMVPLGKINLLEQSGTALGLSIQRARAEEAVKSSEEKYRNLFSGMTEGFGIHEIILDSQGKPCDYRFLELNDAFGIMTGLSIKDVLGKTVKEVLPGIEPYWIETYGKVALTGEPVRFENFSATLNKWYEVYAYAPKKNQFAAIFIDITDRKKAEESLRQYASDLEAANRELEAFSYSVSHDLRAPLRGIDGFSNALLEDCKDQLDEQALDYLNRIRKSSQLMSQLIDGMLKLSRISRAEMHEEKINLSDIVLSIVEEMKQSEPERKAEFKVSPEITAVGDRVLLDALLRNLLENAWKFTSKCPRTRIEFGMTLKDNVPIYYIRDNGIGFDMKYADKLYQPFSRLHNQNDYTGTGIGLANVQRIIRRHGGRIWAESEVGKGATFYFTLEN